MKGSDGKKIVSTNSYSGPTRNDLNSVTDSLGNTTEYAYNTTYNTENGTATGTGTLKSVKDPANYTTSYTYNSANDLLTKVTSPYPDATVNYTYDNYHCLTGITTVTSSYKFAYDEFRNLQKVSVGSKVLSTNTYEDNNGNLTQTKYGNADTVSYEYDSLDRVKKMQYNGDTGAAQYNWTYNRKGEVAKYVDYPEGYTYNYVYDLSGRLLEIYRNDNAYIKTAYDTRNMVTGITYSLGSAKETVSYGYSKSYDYAPTSATFTDGSRSYSYYDTLGRKTLEKTNSSQGLLFNTWYIYLDNSSVSNQTSGLVSDVRYTAISGLENISYTYDSRGNITSVKYGNTLSEKYTYDALSRLTCAVNKKQGKAWVYTYDKNGNILTEKTYSIQSLTDELSSSNLLSTVTYTYGNTNWGDKLTKYNGKAITYDAAGNPLTYDGKTFKWLGRRLYTYNNGSYSTTYRYNSDGIRTWKTVDGTKTEFFLNGSQILAQKTGSSIIPFYYDANGKRIAFKYNGNMYYYVYNLQGDVTHIVDKNKNIVGTYQYDAWGKILNLASLTSIAKVNPFRYRGYYYDTESGFYYLNSRYYSAEWRRFINADGYITTGQGITSYNMFAYCNNNPIINVDPDGTCPYNGSMGDFYRLNHNLRSMDCDCSLSKTISTINDGVGVAVDLNVDIFLYSLINESRPDYWPIKSYNNYITSAVQTTYNVSGIVNNVGLGVSSCCVFIEAIEGVYYNSSRGASNEKIVWDIIIDLSFGTANIFASTATATAVGAFVGTYIPIPVVGTVIGAAAGFGVSYIIDYSATKVKSIRKK